MPKREVRDPRSTGRRRGRAVLEKKEAEFKCGGRTWGDSRPVEEIKGVKIPCGRSPKDYPNLILDVNHINKDYMDNDEVNLEWLCRSCHKYLDSLTEKGVSIKGDEFGYSRED